MQSLIEESGRFPQLQRRICKASKPTESLRAASGAVLAVTAQEHKMRWLWYPLLPFYSLMSYSQLCFTAAALHGGHSSSKFLWNNNYTDCDGFPSNTSSCFLRKRDFFQRTELQVPKTFPKGVKILLKINMASRF